MMTLRWGLLLVPLWGLVDSRLPLAQTDGNFAWLSILATVALAILLNKLSRVAGDTLWVWVILLIFVQGYFVKSYTAAGGIESGEWARLQPELRWMNVETVTEGWYWIVLAFVVFCFTSTFWLSLQKQAPDTGLPDQDFAPIKIKRILGIVIAAFIVYAIASYLQGMLGIGVMGVEYDRLPYHLDTLIFRYRSNIAPAIILLGLWVFDQAENKKYQLIIMLLLLASAFIDSLVTASRGSFIRWLLPAFLVWLVSGRLTRQRKLFLGVVVVLTLIVHPFISTYRYLRIITAEDNMAAMMSYAIEVVSNQELESSYGTSATSMQTRVSGAEGVWFMMNHVPEEFSADHIVNMLFVEDMTAYYTKSIVGVRAADDWRAIGLVGTGMILGGWYIVLLYVVIYLSGTYLLWRYLSGMQTSVVALAMCANAVFIHAGEGGTVVPPLVSLLLSVWLCEWIYRRVLQQKPALQPFQQIRLHPRPESSPSIRH
jgi:hypothetical protein